jgi:hypothetical protein
MLIQTTRGLWPASGLEHREGVDENDNEIARWTEYWLEGELVHRSVHVHLKRGMFADGVTANFS